jgi:hypothetical protein
MTLAVFHVASEQQVPFRAAWQALCQAFLELPRPPSSAMTLIQSRDHPEVFQSLGTWFALEDVQAMRQDLRIVPLMNALVALTESAQPGEFMVLDVIG